MKIKLDKLSEHFSFVHSDSNNKEFYDVIRVSENKYKISWEENSSSGNDTNYSHNTILGFLNDGIWINYCDLTIPNNMIDRNRTTLENVAVKNVYTAATLPRNFQLFDGTKRNRTADRCDLFELVNPLVIICWTNEDTKAINATVYSLSYTLEQINLGIWTIGEVYEN